MPAIRKAKPAAPPDDSVFDDADALIAFAQRSFDKAAKAQVGSSRVDLQACKLEYSIVSPK